MALGQPNYEGAELDRIAARIIEHHGLQDGNMGAAHTTRSYLRPLAAELLAEVDGDEAAVKIDGHEVFNKLVALGVK